jgi:hypothetical protein
VRPKLDNEINEYKVADCGHPECRGRILKPVTVNERSLIMDCMKAVLIKLMDTITRLFGRKGETTYVSEVRHFKKDKVLYVSKLTDRETIELWAHSTINDDSEMLGMIRGGKLIKMPNFYHMEYRKQKYTELLSRIVIEGWEKPYRLWDEHPRQYR